VIATIEDGAPSPPAPPVAERTSRPVAPASDTLPAGAAGHGRCRVTLSPAVRRAVLEHGIDPSTIKGTGKDGRITKEDVLAAAAAKKRRPRRPPPPTPPRPAFPAG
jgi:2-oxoglutarate dehydrogenase E2 component (dihydrolipoamide succinyltransferase)